MSVNESFLDIIFPQFLLYILRLTVPSPFDLCKHLFVTECAVLEYAYWL